MTPATLSSCAKQLERAALAVVYFCAAIGFVFVVASTVTLGARLIGH